MPKLQLERGLVKKLFHSHQGVTVLFLQPLKDWHLFLFVSFLLLIDVIILTLVTSFPTSRQQAKIIPDVERRDGGVNVNKVSKLL